MVWVKKSTIFCTVFLSKIGLEIMLSYGLERKEALEDNKNVNFLKSQKWVFSKGVNPWFWCKNPQFFSSEFFIEIGLEIMLSYGLESKEAFEDDKNVNFFKSKKWVFSKGLTHGFGEKIDNFFYCVSQRNRPRNNVKLRSRKKRSF